MKYNIDLHIHSPYSAGCSKNITIPELSKQAKLKGLNVLGTGDILQPFWFEHCKENLEYKNDCYYFKEDIGKNKTYFILSTEVETKGKVHHLLFFKNLKQAEEFREDIKKYSSDMTSYGGGRPRLSLSPKELLETCIKYNVLLGAAHAFTPYYGIYAKSNTLKEEYGKHYKEIKFIELGLSADTKMANVIPELKDLKLFSFSDAHSSTSYRLGREYVCAELEKPNFESLKNLLNDKGDNYIVYNVGYFPEQGKYFKTSCRDCKKIHGLEDAEKFKWKCSKCKGVLKKGVSDRIKEIAIIQGNQELKETRERPEYKHLLPLIDIVQAEIGKKGIYDKRVIEKYTKIIAKYNEIEVMLLLPQEKLNEIDIDIANLIISFRKKHIVFRPGGAGHYGECFILSSEEEKLKKEKEILKEQEIRVLQKTLF